MQALSLNPTLSSGAQIVAQAKVGEAKSGKANLVAESEIELVKELENRLESFKINSDSTSEILVLLKALRHDTEGSLEALSRINVKRRRKTLSAAVVQLLCYTLDESAKFRRLLQCIDDSKIGEDSDTRRKFYDGWLAHELKFGASYSGHHPLLNPEVFQRFTQVASSKEPAVASFPRELQHLIDSGQVSAQRDSHYGPKKKILVVSDNWNFFPSVAHALKTNGFELRYLDFEMLRQVFPNSDRTLGIARQTRNIAGKPDPTIVRDALAHRSKLVTDLIDWADVVFCEWFTDGAVWMSRYLPEDKALFARLHSYEAFTSYPFLANLPRFDGLIFIAPQIREIITSLVGSAALSNTTTAVIPNFRDVSNFSFVPRSTPSKKILGMTQYASANKDPLFALDILSELQRQDPTWRLRLIGNPWGDEISEAEASYQTRFQQRLAEFGDSVSIEGYTSDIVGWYRSIGFVLSTSQREGSHESLVEGMLTGAVPVLRNWPMMAPFGAPKSVFPDLGCFDTAKEAAEYILQASDQYDERSKAAAEYALDYVNKIDPAVELPRFIRAVCKADDTTSYMAAS